ncbi:MAG: 50S ribosomal protein L10, partial [Desulfurococcales archaeon]|nr:50S ribosomal protein L10 [Desulfurococcales archaeon]
KKRLILRALEKAGIDKDKIEPYLKGSIMLLFTDMNPFKLARLIESEKMPVAAKPGQVTDREIVIPEGDTGLKPGPILSTFGKLRIPYEIRRGTIYVKKDTVVAKPGDVISTDLAGLLQTLGIMPFEVSLKIAAVYDRGVVIPREELLVDLDKFAEDVKAAAGEALLVAAELGIPFVPEALQLSIAKAAAEAAAVAREAAIPLPGTIEEALKAAVAREAAVIAALGDKAAELGLEPVKAPAAGEAKAEEGEAGAGEAEEKAEEAGEEGEGEVDLSEGLSGLFGG